MNSNVRPTDRTNLSAFVRVTAMLLCVVIFICITALRTSGPDKAVLAEKLRNEAHEGNFQRMDELLQEGAAVDQADGDGVTALIEACRTGNDRCVERLLEAGANVNSCAHVYGTPLMQATMNRHETTAEIVLKHGAFPNLRSPGTNSALWWAMDFREPGLIRLLERYGAKSIHV
jgi:ankyrin repeat protein